MFNRRAMMVAISAALVTTPTVLFAADYPTRDVTMIVQSSAGGGSDMIARTVANIIQKHNLLPTRLLVENRPGGGGAIAYNFVAQRKGNPYYIGTIATSFFVAPLMGQSPSKPDDFTPVAAIAGDPFVLVVEANSKIKTLADIKSLGSIRVGNTGPVTDPALLGAQLAQAFGVELRAVPFNGDGEVTTALLGNHIDLQFGNASEVMAQIEAGRVRPLAVTSSERLASLPDIPTFKEQGLDIQLLLYRGFVMPKDVPAEAVAFWENALRKVAESQDWKKEYIERNSSVPIFLDSKAFGAEFPMLTGKYQVFLDQLKKNSQ